MRLIFVIVISFALVSCDSIKPLYVPNTKVNNIILKINVRDRMGQLLESQLSNLLSNLGLNKKLIISVDIVNKKYSEVKFLDGTVARIIDQYSARVTVKSGDDYTLLFEDDIAVSASKNYSSSKVQIMSSTYASIDQSLLSELSNKIFNYIKVKIDHENFIH